MSPNYSVLICPVCLEQVEEDRQHGEACYHEEYGHVEPIRADVLSLDPATLETRRGLALFRLQEDRREVAFRLAERRWEQNLSVADRFWLDQRRKRERREEIAQMGPMGRAVATMMDTYRSELVEQLNTRRPLLDFSGHIPADSLDNWLAEDGRIPEVAAALLGP